MIIRKKFDFEAAHIVRNCTSERCKYSIHGHSFIVELFLKANRLDNGQMLVDFGLLKGFVKAFIDSFDHTMMYWSQDDKEYINFIKQYSDRYISLPVSPSAEILSLFFLTALRKILQATTFANGEGDVELTSVRLHETKSGYAESFLEDLDNPNFPKIFLNKVIFSDAIRKDWPSFDIWDKILEGSYQIINEKPEQQI